MVGQARDLRVVAGCESQRSSRLVPALLHLTYWRRLLGVFGWFGGGRAAVAAGNATASCASTPDGAGLDGSTMTTASAAGRAGCGQARWRTRWTPKLDILRLTTRGKAPSRRMGSSCSA